MPLLVTIVSELVVVLALLLLLAKEIWRPLPGVSQLEEEVRVKPEKMLSVTDWLACSFLTNSVCSSGFCSNARTGAGVTALLLLLSFVLVCISLGGIGVCLNNLMVMASFSFRNRLL